jgi:hypothetical protein
MRLYLAAMESLLFSMRYHHIQRQATVSLKDLMQSILRANR